MSATFGFGSSQRFNQSIIKEVEKIPGPGSYAPLIVTKQRTPSWGIGTQKRVEPGTENKIRLAIPGPTAYNLPSKIQEGPRISLSPRIEVPTSKFTKLVPGPGTYTPAMQKRANFSFSFGLKPENDPIIKHIKAIPGPGTYESYNKETFSKVGASLDKSYLEYMNKTQKLVPGPGAYQPEKLSLISRNSAPKYGFGTSERRAATSHDSTGSKNGQVAGVPGPGQYEIKGVVGNDGPKKSLSYKYKFDQTAKEHLMKPGPGQYAPEINQVIKASPNYKIGTSTRDKFYIQEKLLQAMPPPNNYNPNYKNIRRNSPATGFGYGDRSFLNKTFNVPGPGNYQTPTKVGEGPKYIMGVRLNDSLLEKRGKELPSPDNYNPKFEAVKRQTGVYSVSRAARQTLERKNNVPGPGNYFSQGEALITFKDSPKYGFGSSSQRPNFKQQVEVPGPGNYKIKSTFADVPAYLIPNQNLEYKYV